MRFGFKLIFALTLIFVHFCFSGGTITIEVSKSDSLSTGTTQNIKLTKYKEEYMIVVVDGIVKSYDFEGNSLREVFSDTFMTTKSVDSLIGLDSNEFIYISQDSYSFFDVASPSITAANYIQIPTHSTFLYSLSTYPDPSGGVFLLGTSNNEIGTAAIYSRTQKERSFSYQNNGEDKITCQTRRIAPYQVFCVYINSSNNNYDNKYLIIQQYMNYPVNSGYLADVGLDPSSEKSTFFKLEMLTDTLFLLCIIKTQVLYCETGNIEESTVSKDISQCKGCSEQFMVAASNCMPEDLSISLVSQTTFGVLCKSSANDGFIFSVFSIDEDPSTNQRSFVFNIQELLIGFSEQVSTAELASFNQEFWTIFYVTSLGVGKLEVLNGANCKPISFTVRVGSEITLIDFPKYVHGMNEYFQGHSDEVYLKINKKSDEDVKFYFGDVKNPTEMDHSKEYPLSTRIYFQTQHTSANYKIYYTVSQGGKSSHSCFISLSIEGCHNACHTCDIESVDDDDTKCKNGCYEGFLPLAENSAQCYPVDNERFYIDKNEQNLKRCSSSCLTCKDRELPDDTNCEKCDTANGFYPLYNWETKCIKIPSDHYYLENDKVYKCMEGCRECTNKNTCTSCDDYYTFVSSNKTCINKCSQASNKKYINLCVETCPKGTVEKEGECLIKDEDCINLNEKIDYLGKENMAITLADEKSVCESLTLKNGTANAENQSEIYLGECEKILRDYYNISEEEPLLMKKLDLYRANQVVSQVEYQVFRQNGKELNLSLCENQTIIISSPIHEGNITNDEIMDMAKYVSESGYNIFNSSDPFYTDVCTPFSTEDNTDISIEDRKKVYFKNISFCESNCEFKAIDLEAKRVNCSCQIKTKVSLDESHFSFNELGNQFSHVISNSNLMVIKCYKLVFKSELILKNIGGWVMSTIGMLELIVLANYCFIGIMPLLEVLFTIFKELPNSQSNPPKKSHLQKEKDLKNCFRDSENVPKHHVAFDQAIHLPIQEKKSKMESTSSMYSEMSSSKEIDIMRYSSGKTVNQNGIIALQTKPDKEISEENFTEEDLSKMNFENSIIYDKREFWKIYYSLLKYKQLIIFTFFNNTDFNMKLLKISMFLLSFAMFMVFNEFFYSDSSMTRNYENKGKYDLIYKLPQTIFSSATSTVIGFLLQFLSMTESDIQKIKKEKSIKKAEVMANKMTKYLRFKFAIYFFVTIILMSFFWYYTSAFCAVFYRTQVHMLIDTLISFALTMIYPFFFSFASTAFRVLAIRKRSKCAFYIHKFI